MLVGRGVSHGPTSQFSVTKAKKSYSVSPRTSVYKEGGAKEVEITEDDFGGNGARNDGQRMAGDELIEDIVHDSNEHIGFWGVCFGIHVRIVVSHHTTFWHYS